MSDVVTDGGQGWMEKLKVIMISEINETLGLPDVISAGSQSKCVDGQSADGSF